MNANAAALKENAANPPAQMPQQQYRLSNRATTCSPAHANATTPHAFVARQTAKGALSEAKSAKLKAKRAPREYNAAKPDAHETKLAVTLISWQVNAAFP